MRCSVIRWGALKALRANVILPFALSACGDAEVQLAEVGQLDYAGRVSRIESLGRYSSLDATLLLQFAGPPAMVATIGDYYLYRVIYPTAGIRGGETLVSGLVAVPVTRRIKGIVSWHHGTKTNREFSVSQPTAEGLGTAAVFAGDGFILAAADYIGLGVSTQMQGYYHWPSTVRTIVDLLSIAEVMLEGIGEQPDYDLYLTGFSQGGAATVAVQEELQRNNPTKLKVRAAAAISGAFDLRGLSLDHAIEQDDTFHLGFIAASFAATYGEPLGDLVKSPYRSQLPDWYDGSHDPEFLANNLPRHLEELFTEEFLAGYASGEEIPKWFYDALRAGSTANYVPEAPLRFYYGSADTTVIPEESRQAFERIRASTKRVEAVDLGPYDHEESILRGIPPVQRWFDELERKGR